MSIRERQFEVLSGPIHGARLISDIKNLRPCFVYDATGYLIWDPSPGGEGFSQKATGITPIEEDAERPPFTWTIEDLQREIRRVGQMLPASVQSSYQRAYPKFMPQDVDAIWFPRSDEGIPDEKAIAVITRLEGGVSRDEAVRIENHLANKGVFRVPDIGRFQSTYHLTAPDAPAGVRVGVDPWISQGRVIQKAVRVRKSA